MPIDIAAVGLPAAITACLFIVGAYGDPLVAVAAALMLIPYLFGYVMVGGISRLLQISCGMAVVGLIMTIAGAVGFAVDRDAKRLVYLAAPGFGLFVSSTAACMDSRGRSSLSAPSNDG